MKPDWHREEYPSIDMAELKAGQDRSECRKNELLEWAYYELLLQSAEIERLKSTNRWAELDIAELIDDFGVHPLFWNGVWQACLNETNVPVQHFKTEQECLEWCAKENEDATETPTIKIESLSAENSRLKSYCLDYAEMTGITLNVPDEQREAFNAAVSTEPAPSDSQKFTESVKKCIGNDPLCPCQDGDMCHYEGPGPWPIPEDTQNGADDTKKCPHTGDRVSRGSEEYCDDCGDRLP